MSVEVEKVYTSSFGYVFVISSSDDTKNTCEVPESSIENFVSCVRNGNGVWQTRIDSLPNCYTTVNGGMCIDDGIWSSPCVVTLTKDDVDELLTKIGLLL